MYANIPIALLAAVGTAQAAMMYGKESIIKRDLTSELVKRADIPYIPCSTTEWIDDCTGWAPATPLEKRAELAAAAEVVKRADIPYIPCSTTEWIDNCTGWAPASDLKKREESAVVAVVAKRDVVAEAVSEGISKRADIPFIQCSTTEWIDTCTGWS